MGVADGAVNAIALVDDVEEVCRLCFSAAIPISMDSLHPNQIDDESMIRLEELSWQDFSKRGFSLTRLKLYSLHLGEAEARRRDEKRTEKGQDARYSLAGTLIAKTAEIHAISDDGGVQVFRVLQTPTDAVPAHAEIRISDQFQRKDFLKFRRELRVVLGVLRDKAELDRNN